LSSKKHILIFIDWYLPGYKAGGPIRSCANFVDQLKDTFDFSIVSRDTDFGERMPYPAIKADAWIQTENGVRIFYLSHDNLKVKSIRHLLKGNYDALYLNSLFSFYFTLVPLWYKKRIKKCVLAPRGMFGPGALAIKPLKKSIFLSGSKIAGLFSDVKWQASSDLEAQDIRKYMGQNVPIEIAPNLPPCKKIIFTEHQKKKNHLKLFFLSRITPIKNLLLAMEYLEKIDSRYTVSLDIFGPIEDKTYADLCLRKADLINQNKQATLVNFRGPVENKNLDSVLSNYDCLLLPTANENFGHSILESLALGCPVIISDQTPWRNLREKKIGWDIPLSRPDEFVKAIETLAGMDEKEFNELSLKAFKEAEAFYNNNELTEQNRKLFD